jgi:hypothetical protein
MAAAIQELLNYAYIGAGLATLSIVITVAKVVLQGKTKRR